MYAAAEAISSAAMLVSPQLVISRGLGCSSSLKIPPQMLAVAELPLPTAVTLVCGGCAERFNSHIDP